MWGFWIEIADCGFIAGNRQSSISIVRSAISKIGNRQSAIGSRQESWKLGAKSSRPAPVSSSSRSWKLGTGNLGSDPIRRRILRRAECAARYWVLTVQTPHGVGIRECAGRVVELAVCVHTGPLVGVERVVELDTKL